MNHAVTVLLFNSGRVLAISRGDDLDDWGLIGGKVEDEETLFDAAQREAREEAEVGLLSAHTFPVFTSLARTRMTTTFLGHVYLLPLELPHTREGKVEWKSPWQLCTPSCTYRAYNHKLFTHLGLM